MANTRVYYATQAVGITPRNPGNKEGTIISFIADLVNKSTVLS